VTTVLGNLAFVGFDKFFAEHLREFTAAFLGHDRIQFAIQVPVLALVHECEQPGFHCALEPCLQLVGIEAVGEFNERTVHGLQEGILVIAGPSFGRAGRRS
jgi:hypothetical protein